MLSLELCCKSHTRRSRLACRRSGLDAYAARGGGSVRYWSVRDQQPARHAGPRCWCSDEASPPRVVHPDQTGSQRRNALNASEMSLGDFGVDQGKAKPVRDARISTQALCDRVPDKR
jgi:hypothetical protein